jgi:hypothetical protein
VVQEAMAAMMPGDGPSFDVFPKSDGLVLKGKGGGASVILVVGMVRLEGNGDGSDGGVAEEVLVAVLEESVSDSLVLVLVTVEGKAGDGKGGIREPAKREVGP